jgi:hypothetical protein
MPIAAPGTVHGAAPLACGSAGTGLAEGAGGAEGRGAGVNGTLSAPGEPCGSDDGGAAPNPTSGSGADRPASAGGAPAGRTSASSCALVSLMR